jgi:hypothetical protein
MSKTVRLLVYIPLRIFGFIPTLLHARVTVDKVVVGLVFLRAVRCSRASYSSSSPYLHVTMGWYEKSIFYPVPKDSRNSLLQLRGLVTNINFRNRLLVNVADITLG